MNHTNNIFTKMYPHLDIHGETYDSSDLIIKEFIKDNLKLGHKTVVIIHGIGEGILKQKTHELLKAHPMIKEYYLDVNNLGSTIANFKDNLD